MGPSATLMFPADSSQRACGLALLLFVSFMGIPFCKNSANFPPSYLFLMSFAMGVLSLLQ